MQSLFRIGTSLDRFCDRQVCDPFVALDVPPTNDRTTYDTCRLVCSKESLGLDINGTETMVLRNGCRARCNKHGFDSYVCQASVLSACCGCS